MLTGFLIPPSSKPTAMGRSIQHVGDSAGARTTHETRSSAAPSAKVGNVTIAVPFAGASARSRMSNLRLYASRSMSGVDDEDEDEEESSATSDVDALGSTGGSERKTRHIARRCEPTALAASTEYASGRGSEVLPLAVTHSCGISNANAPGGGDVLRPASEPQADATDPSSHAPSHRTNVLQSSESSTSLWTSAGAPSATGAGSFAPRSTRFTFLTSFLPPLAMATMASHSSAGTKRGIAKTGGSTLSTRTSLYERLTGRNRSAREPR
mmetsp:Transcript_4759/g.19546  ORF Transcript_4759/g.19546 Transcript_4759/m.19546 type:complete len:268 (-) Transcript_4759:304-1107(-)